MDCPGCGMQRSFVELLEGDLYGSFLQFPALIPLLLMIGYLFVHLKFQFKYGAKILMYAFIGNAIIILANYILKLL